MHPLKLAVASDMSSPAAGLPENAGVAANALDIQVANDFLDLSYDAPCPPPALNPPTHHYVFTVYALNTMLPHLPTAGSIF